MEKDFLWHVQIRVSPKALDPVGQLFEKFCIAVSWFENSDKPSEWRVEGYAGFGLNKSCMAREVLQVCLELGEVPFSPLRYELVSPRDWLELNATDFQPTRVGRFFIHGSHFNGPPPTGCRSILLDPGTAFGSGEHGSTAGCLRMIEKLGKAHRFYRSLDMGCGSGILSIAMAKTWPMSVVAADVDCEAVRVTALNARRNGVAKRIVSVRSKGYNSERIKSDGPYDLITANIFMRPLISMAKGLSRNLYRKGGGRGFAILSGILENDGRRVLAAHRPHGLRLCDCVVLDGWLTMLLKR